MRLIVIVLMLLVSLSGCSVINVLRMKSANDDVLPTWKQAQEKQEFEAVYIGQKPYINVEIDGQQLLFLIDTGASFTMLFDTPRSRQVSVQKGYELAVAGWGQESKTPAHQVIVPYVSFGDVKFEDVKLAYIPVSTTLYYLREDEAIMDGVIGHDLLRHFAWTFDKQQQRITIHKQSILTSTDVWAVEFDTTLSKLNVPVEVSFNDNQSIVRDVVIDTGSRHYFKLNTALIEDKNIRFPATITAADFGMSGKVEHQRATINHLKIGDNQFNKVKANLIPSDDDDDWWVIGSALMNQYVSVIDYHSSQFALIPYQQNSFETLYNLSGLELRKLRNGHFVVRYISPDFAAAKTDLAVGDEIVSLNEMSSVELSEEDWLNMANTPQLLSVCVLHKACITFPLTHVDGYSK